MLARGYIYTRKSLLHKTPRSQNLRGILLLKSLAPEDRRGINTCSRGGRGKLRCAGYGIVRRRAVRQEILVL